MLAVRTVVVRCIRHRGDFGAIVLCDPRYGTSGETTASLSKWVRSSVKQCKTVEASLPQVASFFRSHQPQEEQHEVAPGSVGPSDDPFFVRFHDRACGQAEDSSSCRDPEQAAPLASSAVKESSEAALVQQSLSQV